MGRILYGVMGDAGGHVARSLAVAQQLKGHEIVFVGGGRTRELRQAGYSVVETPVLGTVLSGNRVDVTATAREAFRGLAGQGAVVDRLAATIRDFDPDLIVTDYEYFLPRAARRLGRPCVSVDRQHVLTQCSYEPPPGHHVSRWLTTGIIRTMYNAASHYIVCSFVPMDPIDPQLTEVLPPVLRADVLRHEPAEGEHAVVYVRGATRSWIRDLLGQRRRRFIVYGFDVAAEEGNLSFRRASSEGFLADLAGAAYAIANGGHNLISEALHYGKPLLCFPVGLFYEQLVNAHLLMRAGFGLWHAADAGAAAALDAFETRLPEFRANIAARAAWDGSAIPIRLQAMMRRQ